MQVIQFQNKNRIFLVFAAFIPLLFSLTACSGGSPSAVTGHFLDAVQVGDYKGAQQYASAASQTALQALADQELPVADAIVEYTIGKERISGDRAVVEYTAGETAHTMSLVQELGAWKVIFAAAAAATGGSNAPEGAFAQGPGLVGKQFLEALYTGEVGVAKGYATHHSQMDLDMIDYAYKRSTPDKLELLDVKENGNNATLHYRRNEKERWLELVKTGNTWQVEFKRSTEDIFEDLQHGLDGVL